MTLVKKLPAYAFLGFILCACTGKGSEPSPADNTKDRKLMLTHWADGIIVPSYEDFQSVLNGMVEKGNAFTATPDQASLSAFRQAWADAYVAWQKVDLFEFGPADKYTLRNFFNIYPADVAGITANIGNPAANLDLAGTYAQQGFPALDYLLNGTGADDAAILSYYTAPGDGPARLAYISRILTRMQALLDQVISEWKNGYRDSFVTKTGLDVGSSAGLVVNAYILYYERYIRSGKIGIPSAAAFGSSSGTFPEKVEAFYKRDLSLTLAQTAHQAARDFFNGKDARTMAEGPSLKSYLDGLGAKDPATNTALSEIINNQFAAIHAALEQLNPDFYQQIQTENQQMIDTYAAMQKLVRLLKVDMTSAMSISITYTDNDGD